jgi:hypothetical protein
MTVPSARRMAAAALIAASLLAASGCVTRHTFRPETFDVSEQGDIQVFTRNSRTIEFRGGMYTVGDSAGAYFITGNGIEHRPDSLIVKVPYSGRLSFAAIERIETVKTDVYAALYVTLFIGFFAALGFLTDITD